MLDLLIITGPPGSGKSTIAQSVAERFDPCVRVDGDAFFDFVVRGYIDPWLPESGAQNTVIIEAAARAAGRYSIGGYVTIYDGVVGPWFLQQFIDSSGLDELQYVVLMPDADTCMARVRDRATHRFHDEAATRHMHEAFAAASIGERHIVREVADATPVQVADEVLRRLEEGSLAISRSR